MADDGVRQAHSRSVFADERRYRAQRSVYRGSSGPDARDVLWSVLARQPPGALLDVGCGEGELAARAAEAGWSVLGVDTSERMTALTATRGVPASCQDVRHLGLSSERFSCVVAAWLFHYLDEPDLPMAFAEIHRVLEPGGTLVAATQSERHMAELWDRLPDVTYRIPFAAEAAESLLAPWFTDVSVSDVEGTVVFPDYATAREFVANQVRPVSLADGLAHFNDSLAVTRRSAILSAVRR